MEKLASRPLSPPSAFGLLLRGVAALAGVLLAAGPAAAQTLLVDQADGNSPYAVTADQTYTDVHVGDTGFGALTRAPTPSPSTALAPARGSSSATAPTATAATTSPAPAL